MKVTSYLESLRRLNREADEALLAMRGVLRNLTKELESTPSLADAVPESSPLNVRATLELALDRLAALEEWREEQFLEKVIPSSRPPCC